VDNNSTGLVVENIEIDRCRHPVDRGHTPPSDV
jgi:hypothetical protein